MTDERKNACCDFESTLNRRDFVRVLGGTAAAAGALPVLGTTAVGAAPAKKQAAETAVTELYSTLTEAQQKVICFPFNHKLRTKINANWNITEPEIGDDFYTKEQRELSRRIVKGITSEDGYERLLKQMDDDAGGFDRFSMAIFGNPEKGDFQWELTGRHLTMRADGNSVPGMAFGGPLVYGHGETDPSKNMYHYQTKQANKLFGALDEKHRKAALLTDAPRESSVPLQGEKGMFPGISVGSLSSDQQELVEETLKVLLAPYRAEDVNEAMAMLKAGGGLGKLHMAYYKKGDLNNDQTWDIWRVEGPTFVWHFRGAPHVHTYVNIGQKA